MTEGSKPTTWSEMVEAAFAAIQNEPDGHLRSCFFFWLGGVSKEQTPEGRMLLALYLAGEITAAEAVSEEPAKWIQMIRDLQDLDNIPETASGALKKWRELSPTAQRLVVEKFENEKKERIAKGLPTEPTSRDRERLKRGAQALALDEPKTNRQVLEQLDVLHTGIAALQSMDDLGSDAANRRAMRDIGVLIKKHDRLQKRAAKI